MKSQYSSRSLKLNIRPLNKLCIFFLTAMEQHKKYLQNLCRVCGKNSKTYKHDINSDLCKAALYSAFEIAAESECENIFPKIVSLLLSHSEADTNSSGKPAV